MGRNLRSELREEVFNAFQEGASKREYKRAGIEGRIYSYGSRNAMLDTVTDFAKYVKSEYGSNIKKDQVDKGMVIAYLDSKSHSCTQATVDEYRSRLSRLGLMMGKDLKVDRVLADRKVDMHRGAQSTISRKDLDKILTYTQNHPSLSGICIQLECELGIRVSEMAYGIKIMPQKLEIQGKNGKMCYRDITPRVRAIIDSRAFQEALTPNGKFKAVKDNSINKYLSRVESKLGLDAHSFHDIRRRVAQEKYDEFRRDMSRSEAIDAVSEWLNHGKGRAALVLRSYVSNAW